MTAAERRLWHVLKPSQFQDLHFRRQQATLGFIVDFYCDIYGLIIELDGAVHDSTVEYDQARDKILTDQGFTILRFSND